MLNYSLNGRKFNRMYLQRFGQVEAMADLIEKSQKNQVKAEENREEEILKREEIRNKKANKLYDKLDDLLKISEKFVKRNKKIAD